MDRILEELARHTDDATRPDVDLYLASGPVLRGRVVKVAQGMATVHLGPAKELSVAYVRVEQIIAVTVLASARSARSLTPAKGVPSHHDDIITPVNELSLAAMKAAMATVTPPENEIDGGIERALREDAARNARRDAITPKESASKNVVRREDAKSSVRESKSAAPARRDDVSSAFDAMRVETGSVPAPDPIAEFVASQYDVITPPDPIVPVSIELPAQVPIEAPTYLGERPQRKSAPPSAPPEIVAPTYLGQRPQPRAKTPTPAAVNPSALAAKAPEMTFSMRSDTPKPKAPRSPPPSRPDLMRQANALGDAISRMSRHRVDVAIAAPLDDDARRAIGYALPIASDVLLAMFGERQRPALESILSVELVSGEAEVVLDKGRLVIRCSLVDRFTPQTLRVAIEAVS